jgi:hypothetical protein
VIERAIVAATAVALLLPPLLVGALGLGAPRPLGAALAAATPALMRRLPHAWDGALRRRLDAARRSTASARITTA